MILRFLLRHPLWSVFALALMVRVAFVLATRIDPFDPIMVDSGEYDSIARRLLAGEGYGVGLDKIFIRPPAYPVFIALCYAFGGLLTLQVAQVVISASTAVLVAIMAGELWSRPLVRPVAGVAAALYPWTFAYVGGIASETLFVFLWVASAVLILRAGRRPTLASSALAGSAFGLAALARANLLVIGPPIAAWYWWRTRSLPAALAFGVAVVASLTPFAAYQWERGNGLVLSSNGGGISFYIGNNPGQTKLYAGLLPEEDWHKASFLTAEAEAYIACPGLRCLETIPMKDRDAFFYSAGLRYIREDPLGALTTDVRKLFHYWRPWVDPRAYPMPVVIVTGSTFGALLALAVFGLVRMPRANAPFIVLALVAATATAVLWHVQLRYRSALVDPLLLAAAAGPLASVLLAANRLRSAATTSPVFAGGRRST